MNNDWNGELNKSNITFALQLETLDPTLADMFNAHASFDVNPQQPSSGSYLSVHILDENIEVGRKLVWEFCKHLY